MEVLHILALWHVFARLQVVLVVVVDLAVDVGGVEVDERLNLCAILVLSCLLQSDVHLATYIRQVEWLVSLPRLGQFVETVIWIGTADHLVETKPDLSDHNTRK